MTAGETLLKITDIPFSYSLMAIITGVIGVNLDGEKIIILIGAAGALGTFLAVTDPIGRLLKSNLVKGINEIRKKDDSKQSKKWDFTVKAVKTRAIGVEIDKLVSMAYIVIVLGVFSTAISQYESFAESLQLFDDDNQVLCDIFCIQGLGVISAFIGVFFVALVGVITWRDLKNHVITAGIHHIGISSEYVTSPTIEHMSRAIEQNDWQTASEWAKIIETEIKTEKGKKDFNIESVRQFYRPLYEESISIHATAQNILNNDLNATFPSGEWDGTTHTIQLMIKDESLIDKLTTLYTKIKEYNAHPRNLESKIQKIIEEEATKFYGKNVKNVSYFFNRKTGGSSPALWDCLRSGEHPVNRNIEPFDSKQIVLNTSDVSSEPQHDAKAFGNFDQLWEIMLKRVKEETMSTKLKDLAKEIQDMNNEIKPIFVERIQKQWP